MYKKIGHRREEQYKKEYCGNFFPIKSIDFSVRQWKKNNNNNNNLFNKMANSPKIKMQKNLT